MFTNISKKLLQIFQNISKKFQKIFHNISKKNLTKYFKKA